MTIAVSRIDGSTRQGFLALSQHYEAEFSRITGRRPDTEGHYPFTDEMPGKYEAWMFLEDGKPVGFSVIDVSQPRIDVAEFYIIPAMRRRHIGLTVACELFDRYPGNWQVRQIKGAEYARDFWVNVIRDYCGDRFENGHEADPQWGFVYTQKFTSNKRR